MIVGSKDGTGLGMTTNLGGGDRVLEADKETELVLDKIQLYKPYQTVNVKGSAFTWGDTTAYVGLITTSTGVKGNSLRIFPGN
jgi:hypothetical protein